MARLDRMSLPRRSLVLCVAILALASCALDRPEVARVGDEDVAAAELERSVSLQRALADLQGAPCGRPAAGESEDAACHRAVLSGELLWLAVARYAEEHDLGASQGEVARAVGQLEAQVGAKVLDDALASRSVTRKDLNELGRRLITIRAVRTAVAAERVGDDELRKLYDQRILDYTTIQADHILVETRAEAEDVYRRVRDATEEEFQAVARRVSIEPGAKDTGGSIGTGAASGYVEPFARAAVALEPGEVSEPVQTQFGWHVIYLVDKTLTPFAEAQPQLLEPLADQEFQAWLQERAATLDVMVNPRYGHFVARTFSVSAVRSTDPEGDAVSPAP
jgi:parvulin-like peptidyl-prolyl isomerase